jgi:hypothetical protein
MRAVRPYRPWHRSPAQSTVANTRTIRHLHGA